MAATSTLTAFTAEMRAEFSTAYEALRPVAAAPFEAFTTRLPSTARVENYAWMSPPPRLKRWMGKRNYTTADWSKYAIENLQYSAEERFSLRDVEDLQVNQLDGFKLRMQALAKDVTMFPGREVIKALVNGTTKTCFDGTAFFADSHTIGTGDNLLTKNCAASDGSTNKVIALLKTGVIKPVVWQDRKDKGLMDNTDTSAHQEQGECRMWYDYEGAAGYGFWWDAVHMTVTDIPTVNEVEEIISAIELAFRGFKLDKSSPGEDDYVIHEQIGFNNDTIVYLVNPTLEAPFRSVLTSETIQAGTSGGTKTNLYRGHGDLIVSAYLGS